ncbi:helix-turn-helix domain-containing protein [Dyadobacter linearis]|nr:helix-turn-helix domain-containing protein [Dyadobacter sp. CECT 9623]
MVEKKANEKGNQHILTGGQIVTRKDLEEFKQDILQEIHKLLRPINRDTTKKWLKSREVRKMLDISPGKLYLLRANRQLGFMRIVGVIYYDHEDIEKMLNVSKPRCLNEKSRIVTTNGFGRQIPPIWHQVVVYFSQQAASNRQAIAFFKYYRCRRWLSDRGKPIKNWKKLAWTWIWYKA